MLGTRHATRPHEVIHFDYAYVCAAKPATAHGYEHVLVIMDEFSKFVHLIPTESADAETTVRALLEWMARYGIVRNWVSDQGTHFLNKVVEKLSARLEAEHHFTAAYAPWSNGQVERMNRELRELLSVMRLEEGIPEEEWPTLLPLVEYTINNTPTERLAGCAPVTVHIGREPTSPLDVVLRSDARTLASVPMDKGAVKEHVTAFVKSLEDIHRKVNDQPQRKRKEHGKGQAVDFAVGDYVMIAPQGRRGKNKTLVAWEGPAQVMEEVNSLRYKVKDIASGNVKDVHAAHVKRYADSDLVVTEQLKGFAAFGGQGYTVDHVNGHEKKRGEWRLKVFWDGYGPDSATWEAADKLFEDAPVLVRQYINVMTDERAKEQLCRLLDITVAPGRRRAVATAQ
jgi:transposase InsO family protein